MFPSWGWDVWPFGDHASNGFLNVNAGCKRRERGREMHTIILNADFLFGVDKKEKNLKVPIKRLG